MTARQYSTFLLDKFFFGIEVMKVQEVIRYQAMTRVPLAHSVIRGLINLRGQIVPAIDLRRRLNLNDREKEKLPMNVVVRSGEGVVSLLVDEIGDVLEVSEDLYEAAPETVDKSVKDLLQGVFKLEGKLLLVLDTEKVVALNSDPAGAEPQKELVRP